MHYASATPAEQQYQIYQIQKARFCLAAGFFSSPLAALLPLPSAHVACRGLSSGPPRPPPDRRQPGAPLDGRDPAVDFEHVLAVLIQEEAERVGQPHFERVELGASHKGSEGEGVQMQLRWIQWLMGRVCVRGCKHRGSPDMKPRSVLGCASKPPPPTRPARLHNTKGGRGGGSPGALGPNHVPECGDGVEPCKTANHLPPPHNLQRQAARRGRNLKHTVGRQARLETQTGGHKGLAGGQAVGLGGRVCRWVRR
eukprot:scaffold15338_cov140-Isochrysis_galbana.AAC.2